ncbi:MAG: DNRLRE domain-containing protein [Myxococcota bacterium]|nr:DNRLRE domain-containing protein [Myxococcota bacterium]
MPIRSLLLLAQLLSVTLTLGARPAAALTITTADGVGADTYVRWREAEPETDTNYGDATTVRVLDPRILNSTAFSNTRKPYLRFDLSAVGDDVVTAATLQLTYAGTATGELRDSEIQVFGLDDGDPGESWGELDITWTNAPGNFQSCCNFDGNVTSFLGEFTREGDLPAGEIVSFSSAALLNFLNADTDGQVTLMLAGVGNGQRPGSAATGVFSAFTAKESATVANGTAQAPTLELDVVPIPEPSTAALLGLGLGALATARRRV